MSILDQIAFRFLGHEFSLGILIMTLALTVAIMFVYIRSKKWINTYAVQHPLSLKIRSRIYLYLVGVFILGWWVLMSWVTGIDFHIAQFGSFSLSVSNLIAGLLVLCMAGLADNAISSRINEEVSTGRFSSSLSDPHVLKSTQKKITRIVEYILLIIVLIILIRNFNLDKTLHVMVVRDSVIPITITKIMVASLVLLGARLFVWLVVNIFLYGWYKKKDIDQGKQFAYNQLLSYLIYIFAVLIAAQYVGVNLTLLWAGAAALLVGIGFAMQQTISDFFSGLIILFERSVEVGDFLEVGTEKGTIRKIGLRSSVIETLERKTIIMPNSKLTNDNVTNWSNYNPITRFDVKVGVAYGSDTEIVTKLLLEAANNTQDVLNEPKPFVRFLDFGDNSLNFAVFFFSKQYQVIEDVKSRVRYRIDKLFRDNHITIPFPQRDLWIKSIESNPEIKVLKE